MKKAKNHSSPMAWVWGQTGRHKKQYVFSVVLATIGVAFSLAPYFAVVGIVYGLMNENTDLSFYLISCLLMAVFWIGRVLFHALSTGLSHRATFAVLAEIRKKCLEKLAKIPLGAVLEQSSGALKNTLIERIDSIETTLAHIVPEFTANLLVPFFIMVYIFVLDWRMGLASVATMPIGMFCYAYMMKKSDRFYRHTIEATKALNDTAVEYIGGIQVIKVFGKTKSSYERFVHDANEAAHSYIDRMRVSILPFTSATVIMPATLVFVLPIGALLVKNQILSAQNLITVLILSVGLITPLITLMSYSDDLMKMGTVFGEVQKILDAPEMKRPAEAEPVKNNNIQLHNVHFAYHEKEVLHGVSLSVPEGSFIALVGPSGGGKTTLINLLARFWDVGKGEILLGGHNVKEYEMDSLMANFSFVFQSVYLFHDTVANNIRFGRTDTPIEEVVCAAKRACCHDFISALPNGYDTVIGEGGANLSGGEKQRISIARAILKNAPIIFLDEATANIDPENENDLIHAIGRLTEEKTVIMIAHRLKTVKNADQILVVDRGRIVQRGKHAELMKQNGIYRKLINSRNEAVNWEIGK